MNNLIMQTRLGGDTNSESAERSTVTKKQTRSCLTYIKGTSLLKTRLVLQLDEIKIETRKSSILS